jgi:hypothetical protein
MKVFCLALFFKESGNFARRNAQLFDFAHTSSAALWNLRWQVQGFVGVHTAATESELSGRFAIGSGIRANNLRGTCIETSWEDQLEQFAQIVSTSLIAMYEGWAEELMSKFGSGLAKQVQFPTRGKYGQVISGGVGDALAQARASGISNRIERAFYPKYATHRKCSLRSLDALLALYRYHKEIRNSFVHRGGIANDKAEEAWRNASTLKNSDIGGRSAPALSIVKEGEIVKTSLYEAIQLSDVLLRIVHTIDAELCFTSVGEQAFLNDWRNNEGARALRTLPAGHDKKAETIKKIVRRMGYLPPADIDAVYELGHRAGLVIY